MDPKVRKISQRLKSTNEWNDRLQLLNQYYNNTLQSTENTTVEVFVYTAKGGKPVAKKVYFRIPSEIAANLPYNTKIEYGSHLYEPLTDIFAHADPESSIIFYHLSESEVEYFQLYDRGTIPKPETTNLAEEKVADGTQLLPQHPFIDPNSLIQTTNQDCLPFYLVQHLERSWNKYYKEPLTQNTILRYLNRFSPILSVKDVEPFLQKYRLHLTIIDLNDTILYEYNPETDNKKRNKDLPSSITFLQHNAHITPLNYNLKSYKQLDFTKQKTLHYLDKNTDWVEIPTEEQLTKSIQQQEEQYIYYTGKTDLFQYFVDKELEPQLNVQEGKTISSYVLYNPHKIIIRPSEISLNSYNLLKNAALQPNFKSYYSESLRRALNDLKHGHLRRSFLPTTKPKFVIDIVRSYSANLKDIEYFPVFDKTDVFQPFQEPIQPYTIYLVRNTEYTPERYLIANQTHNLVSGFVLLQSKLRFQILAQCKPSSVEPNTIKDVLKQLYKDPNNPDLKNVANITLGLCAKLGHQKLKARFTTSVNEAAAFSEDYTQFYHGYLSVKKEPFQEFNEGYFGIAFLVYDLHRLRMLELYRKLIAQNITVYGIATDSFYIDRKPNLPLFNGKTKTWYDLGKYQLEPKSKQPPLELADVSDRQTTAVITHYPSFISLDSIQPNQNTFTTATIAGAGKSYSQFEYAQILPSSPTRTTDTLVVILSTKQILSTKSKTKNAEVITYAQFLGRIYDDDCNLKKRITPFNTETYKILILDELLQIPPKDYLEVLNLCNSYKHLQILGNGDYFQNSTGGLPTNYSNRIQFYEATLPYVFRNRVHLTKSRRLNNKEDEIIVNQIHHDLFQNHLSINEVITKYNLQTFTDINFANDKIVIPYTNLAGALLAKSSALLKFKGYDKQKPKLEKLGEVQFDGNVHYVLVNNQPKQFLVKNQV